jgi:hypothetical protein
MTNENYIEEAVAEFRNNHPSGLYAEVGIAEPFYVDVYEEEVRNFRSALEAYRDAVRSEVVALWIRENTCSDTPTTAWNDTTNRNDGFNCALTNILSLPILTKSNKEI